MKFVVLFSLVGFFITIHSMLTKEAVWVKSIPVCTEKAVSPTMYCDYCHDDDEY